MGDFLSIEDCTPNLNTVMLSGRVRELKAMTSKMTGMAFAIEDKKQWPNGQTQVIPIPCMVTGAAAEKLKWLTTGMVVSVKGEVTNRASVYAFEIQPWFSSWDVRLGTMTMPISPACKSHRPPVHDSGGRGGEGVRV